MELEIEPKNKLMKGHLKLGDYIMFEEKYFRVTCIGYKQDKIKSIKIDLSSAKLGKKIIIKKLPKKERKR